MNGGRFWQGKKRPVIGMDIDPVITALFGG
jgi:hypothetical protein